MRASSMLVAVIGLAGCLEPTLSTFESPPLVALQLPADGATFEEGETIEFVGRVSDNSSVEDLRITWIDNATTVLLDEVLPDADGYVRFTTADLDPGGHAITLRAVDAGNLSAEANVGITIAAVVNNPTVEILHPDGAEQAEATIPFLFEANVADPQDDPTELAVEVESDLDGVLASLDADGTGLAQGLGFFRTAGPHRVTFTVTDTDGNTGRRSTIVTVIPIQQNPIITPVTPTPGGAVLENTIQEIRATIIDRQDPSPTLTGSVSSDLQGELCAFNIDTAGVATCYQTFTVRGNHTLTYRAQDTQGNISTVDTIVLVTDSSGIDDDGDGFSEILGDCDDANRLVYPNAPELADGVDNDCDGYADEGTILVDDDGDGFCESIAQPCTDGAGGGDCNDAAPTAYPGANEVCDGVDNDCDGSSDEAGAQGCVTFYLDADGDTYGADNSATCACSAPGAQYVVVGGDCDDGNRNINPSGVEAADGVDNNCDGRRDEGTNRYDDDGDGYCEAAGCTAQPGQVTPWIGGDCNDTRADVNPGAREACGNGLDDNCNNQQDEGQDALGCGLYWRDQDGDGFGGGAAQCYCQPTGGYTQTQNIDCLDTNQQVHPNQRNWFTGHRGDGSYDYNCDGVQEKEFGDDQEAVCRSNSNWAFAFCDAEQPGWPGDPPDCGRNGTWYDSCVYRDFSTGNPALDFIAAAANCALEYNKRPNSQRTVQQRCR